MLLIATPKPMLNFAQRHARTTSPPTPVGNTWLKKAPTYIILSKATGPGEDPLAARMRCQRNPPIPIAVAKADTLAADRNKEAWPMISPARRRSKRAANIAINPAVTSSRAPMLKPLTMAGVAKLPISDDATDLRVDHPDPRMRALRTLALAVAEQVIYTKLALRQLSYAIQCEERSGALTGTYLIENANCRGST